MTRVRRGCLVGLAGLAMAATGRPRRPGPGADDRAIGPDAERNRQHDPRIDPVAPGTDAGRRSGRCRDPAGPRRAVAEPAGAFGTARADRGHDAGGVYQGPRRAGGSPRLSRCPHREPPFYGRLELPSGPEDDGPPNGLTHRPVAGPVRPPEPRPAIPVPGDSPGSCRRPDRQPARQSHLLRRQPVDPVWQLQHRAGRPARPSTT